MALEFECTKRIAQERPDLVPQLETLEAEAKEVVIGDVEGFVESALAMLMTTAQTEEGLGGLSNNTGWPRIAYGPKSAM